VVVLALLSLGFVATAVGAHLRPGATRLGQSIGAVISLGLLVICTRWAIRVEHRLRAQQPTAQTWQEQLGGTSLATPAADPAADLAPPGHPAPAATPARRTFRGRRHYGPVSTGVALALFVVFALVFAGGAISSYSQAVRSSYVQHHGIRAVGTVASVSNSQTCSRGGCNDTAAIVVTLQPPVHGQRTTTVHYPDSSDLASGDRVAVLVDPKQPDYAEFPGARFQASWTWILLVVFAVLFGVGAWFEARALKRMLAHRRAQRAQTAAGGTVAAASPS
jgi:hypothetical protein